MKIPATVITGFLGSGKTTLIRHLLGTANGTRIALVINEFGDLGIDAEVLKGCGIEGCAEDDVVELANGCICCTVADDFLPTMEMLLERPEPPQHIVIETSGLALPKPLVRAFNWPEIRSRVTVNGVVAVIDAPAVAAGRFADDVEAVQAERAADDALDHDAPLAEVFEDQLHCADMVVLNKTDLLDTEALAKVRSDITEKIGTAVKVVSTVHAAIDSRVLLGIGAAVEDHIEARPSCHDDEDGEHDHDDFDSFTVALDPVADPEALEKRLEAAVHLHDILRIKGFVDVSGKEMRHVVQCVGSRIDRYYDRPWGPGETRRGQLVVIGQKGLDEAAIRRAIAG
jgi:cobalamin biosynthesis protein CobW